MHRERTGLKCRRKRAKYKTQAAGKIWKRLISFVFYTVGIMTSGKTSSQVEEAEVFTFPSFLQKRLLRC